MAPSSYIESNMDEHYINQKQHQLKYISGYDNEGLYTI
jgi:hypothetical protein